MPGPKHLGTVKFRGDEYRFVFDLESRGGTYSPELHIYRKGPNGSPAGVGPKGWPQWVSRRLHPQRQWAAKYRAGHVSQPWTDMLSIEIPHLSFWRAYQLRKYRLWPVSKRLYQWNYRLLRKVGT